jgi:hypothetical protein
MSHRCVEIFCGALSERSPMRATRRAVALAFRLPIRREPDRWAASFTLAQGRGQPHERLSRIPSGLPTIRESLTVSAFPGTYQRGSVQIVFNARISCWQQLRGKPTIEQLSNSAAKRQ